MRRIPVPQRPWCVRLESDAKQRAGKTTTRLMHKLFSLVPVFPATVPAKSLIRTSNPSSDLATIDELAIANPQIFYRSPCGTRLALRRPLEEFDAPSPFRYAGRCDVLEEVLRPMAAQKVELANIPLGLDFSFFTIAGGDERILPRALTKMLPHILTLQSRSSGAFEVRMMGSVRHDLGVSERPFRHHPIGKHLHVELFRFIHAVRGGEPLERHHIVTVQAIAADFVAAHVIPFITSPVARRVALLGTFAKKLGDSPRGAILRYPPCTLRDLAMATGWLYAAHLLPPLADAIAAAPGGAAVVNIGGVLLACGTEAAVRGTLLASAKAAGLRPESLRPLEDVFGPVAATHGEDIVEHMCRVGGCVVERQGGVFHVAVKSDSV